MPNLPLQENFRQNKKKFFQQQSFDNNRVLKKWSALIGAMLVIYETIMYQVFIPKVVTDSRPRIDITFTIVFFIAVILYYITIFKLSGNSTKKVYMVRYIIMWMSLARFCYATATRIYDDISNRIEDNNVEKWFYSVVQSRDVGWMILLTDILIPVWYAKLAVPTAYWIPKIIAYYAYDLENKGLIWACFSFSTLFMTMLWGMKNYYEWKNFEGRANIEAWDDVHRNILDKVPDAIAVIDAKAEIIYSNSTFKTLFQDSVESLSQKITQCKRSGTVMFESTAHPDDGKSFHNPNLDETRVFYTFSDILHRNVLPLIQGRHKLENYITFSAKMTTMIGNEQTFRSYEIKLGSLVEYDKAILILTDVTQRELAISLETANQYKDKLLATVSHDLRAPINGSVSLIESTIEHEAVPEFIKEQFLIPAQRSCKFLLHLANDILDFSQINAQKLRMNFETNSLIETIKNCYHLVEMQANKKKIHYRLDLADDLPDMFTTDHNRLSQVIINLLTNAIKFTFSGSVTLSAHVFNDLIQIKVTDTGIGIKDKDKEKLFQEFTRIEYDKQDINTRGVGLGLVIANKLAKKLGPSYKKTGISLSSTFGQGSTFELLLEDKKLSDNDNQTEANKEYSLTNSKSGINLSLSGLTYREEDFLFQRIDEGDLSRNRSQYNPRVPSGFSTRRNLLSNSTYFMASPASQRKKRFSGRALVVDDDAINIIAFETILKRYGIAIDVAYNGKQAVEKIIPKKELNEDKEEKCDTPKLRLLTREYNIIFMDYEMPVMDGIETTKTLIEFMKNKEIYNIPIIGCTGHQDQEKHKNCLNSGMVDIITKPPMREKLLEILERYVGHSD